MEKAVVFLMFSGKNHGRAKEAIDFYTGLFDNSRIDSVELFPEDPSIIPGIPPAAAGTVKRAEFTVCGREFMAHDSFIDHAFNFTPSVSLFIDFSDAERLKTVHAALTTGGRELMPVGNYGFSQLFSWVEDRYGVSWQLNVP